MKDFSGIANTTGAFPAVAAVDASAPTAYDGTPLTKEVMDDFWGALQALLFRADDAAPSGTSEAYNASDFFNALATCFRTGSGVQRGLELSNNISAPTAVLDIAAGVALASASPYHQMIAAAAWSKTISGAGWAAGNGGGVCGRASATNLTGAKTFHVFMLSKPSTAATAAVIDFGFDTSLTATNLLSDATGYAEYLHIGSILWDGAAIVQFYQDGDDFYLKTPVQSLAFTTLPTVATATALSVPTGKVFKAKFSIAFKGGGSGSGTGYGIISNALLGDIVPSSTVFDTYVEVSSGADNSSTAEYERLTDASAQITTRFDSVANNVNYAITTRGWTDRRGKAA